MWMSIRHIFLSEFFVDKWTINWLTSVNPCESVYVICIHAGRQGTIERRTTRDTGRHMDKSGARGKWQPYSTIYSTDDSYPLGVQRWLYCSTDKNEIWRQSLLCGRPSCMEQSTISNIREADSLHSFNRKLKTHLFTLCFNDWLSVFTNFCNAFPVRCWVERVQQPPLTYLLNSLH